MAYITSVETQSVTVGECAIPPIASIEAWPSLDPQAIASFHNTGMHLGEGLFNQLGLTNTLGLLNKIGINNAIGLNLGVGGQIKGEPSDNSSALSKIWNSPAGRINGFATYNGTPLDLLHSHSDATLKKNILPLKNCLDKVLNLQGVSFEWNKDVSPYVGRGKESDIGLIAQDVEKVLPELVFETELSDLDHTVKNVNYDKMVSVLIEAIKEQQEQINSLKETVQELSTKLAECCS